MREKNLHAALRENPLDELSWKALADFLDDAGQGDRAELLRLTRKLQKTSTAERAEIRQRLVGLLARGVQPVVVEKTNSIGMKFVLIPAGKFRMGTPPEERSGDPYSNGSRQRVVVLSRAFFLGAHPVTQGQWKQVMGKNPSRFCPTGRSKDRVEGLDVDRFPVENVGWKDAKKFLTKLAALPLEQRLGYGYRLPTEAEWEYACRAGMDERYPFCLATPSATLSSTQANFDGNNPSGDAPKGTFLGRTCAVGSYEANPFGLYDMHGNVFEWCSDWFAPYPVTDPDWDPTGPRKGEARCLRGGSWMSPGHACRAGRRVRHEPDAEDGEYEGAIGLRVVLEPEQDE
jgi:uncharacterized protein (TIGR02996 family)